MLKQINIKNCIDFLELIKRKPKPENLPEIRANQIADAIRVIHEDQKEIGNNFDLVKALESYK